MPIVDGELFSLEKRDGAFISVYAVDGALRVVVASGTPDEAIGGIDLDEVNASRLRRAVDEWMTRRQR